MKSEELLLVLNRTNVPVQLLANLSKAGFAVTDFTEEGDSVLHVLAKSRLSGAYNFRAYLDILTAAGADINALDKQGRDFLSYYLEKAPRPFTKETFGSLLKKPLFKADKIAPEILLNFMHFKKDLVASLLNHEQFSINTLDPRGNTYLQSIILSQPSCSDIMQLLIKKGINVTHKNYDGKTAYDLLIENTLKRDAALNETLVLDLLNDYPALLTDKDFTGEVIFHQLLKSKSCSSLGGILSAYQRAGLNPEPIKSGIFEYFNAFHQKLVPEYNVILLTYELTYLGFDIDVEYCLAIAAIANPSIKNNTIFNNLQKLRPSIDLKAVVRHIKNLTLDKSGEEQRIALNSIAELLLQQDCFDDEILPLEEHYWRAELKHGVRVDSNMFGHLFSLNGYLPDAICLTGSFPDDNAPFMSHLMNAYVSHCIANGKHTANLQEIKQVRDMNLTAMRRYFLSLRSPDDEHLKINPKHSALEIYTGWAGHTMNIIIRGDDIYRNNGGELSTDTTTEHYKMTTLENLEGVLPTLYYQSSSTANKKFIQEDMHTILGMQFVGSIPGKFQTVGNCGFESMRIALRVKYRLFLPEAIAEEIYADTLAFFEQFYLEEYISRYIDHPILPHILIRLIIQKLIPEQAFELVNKLLTGYFTSDANQEILQMEFMIKLWTLRVRGNSTEEYEQSLKKCGVVLNPQISARLQILDHFINDNVTPEDLDQLKKWPLSAHFFQGHHVLNFAVMNNNLSLAASLVTLFPQAISYRNWSNQEPLCLVQSVEMVDLLINAGASVESTKVDNVLDHAIKANKPAVVRALLNHGAQISKRSMNFAAIRNPKILRDLIEFHPEEPKRINSNGGTPMHEAAACGYDDNLQYLIQHGGNPAALDINGETPLHVAAQYGHWDTAIMLANSPYTLFNRTHRGDDAVSMTKDPSIQRIIELKRAEKAADLAHFAEFKSGLPGVIKDGIDYLIVALRKNDLRAIRGCLLTYPNINVVETSSYYLSPLALAIQNLAQKSGGEYENAFAIVKLLLQTSGVDLNKRMATNDNEPLLFMVTSIGDVGALELFLSELELDPNQQDNLGDTALHNAVKHGHFECVQRLLNDERVDSSIENKKQETAAAVASSKPRAAACRDMVLEHQAASCSQVAGLN